MAYKRGALAPCIFRQCSARVGRGQSQTGLVWFIACGAHSGVALRQLAEVEHITPMFFVYSLFNQKHGKIYIGQTDNLEERMKLHHDRVFRSSFTSRFDGNWILIYRESCPSRKDALRRERELKSYQGRQFIKKFIPA
ncbi:MAG: GIY-YIG nuclease family protein [Candidatus Wildermuthbacteria bacterium]|nr:GIY-YIG nuclease family protein [Candidatus Wildermuthbacteria bacterium]